MPRYMIEAPHDHSPAAWLRILGAVVTYGSHFLTHADWGCLDGEHKAWITIEARDESEARVMLPPILRNTARVVKLNKFTPEQIRELNQTWKQRNPEELRELFSQLQHLAPEQIRELQQIIQQQSASLDAPGPGSPR